MKISFILSNIKKLSDHEYFYIRFILACIKKKYQYGEI